jgi:hypothetical protein
MKTNSNTLANDRAHPPGADPTPSPSTSASGRCLTTGVALSLLLFTGMAQANNFIVTTTTDSGLGSLRQAILDANANPGPDTIVFAIPGAGVHTISPTTGLPAITEAVAINGYNQADSTWRTEINGALTVTGVFVDGVSYISAPSTFGNGSVSGSLAVVLGPDGPDGLSPACAPLPVGSLAGKIALISRGTCTFASKIQNVQNAGAIGVIVVNGVPGVFPMGGLDPNSIPAFMVSSEDRATLMTKDGTLAILAPSANGLYLASGSSGSTISGLVINGFPEQGIRVASSGNMISGNFIGTDVTGTSARPNGDSGVRLFSGGNTVQDNLLSGNVGDGVSLNDGANTVLNNKVGSDVTGTVALGNGRVGIWVGLGAGSSIKGNLIAANGSAGVLPGIQVDGGSPATLIQNNTISGNATHGILLRSGDNLVGGLAPGEGNIIAFNARDGVSVENPAVNNAILGNSIYSNGLLGIDLGLDGVTLNDNFPALVLSGTDITAPGDPIVGSSANFPAPEQPANAIDGNSATKYLNFDKEGSGFIVTPSGSGIVTGMSLTSANDAPARDPKVVELAGSNNPTAPAWADPGWTTIATISDIAFSERFETRTFQFANATAYTHYRWKVLEVANSASANSMQIAEVELLKDVMAIGFSQDPDAGPNHRQNFPVLNATQSVLNPALVIAAGSLSSEPNTDYLVQVFSDDAGSASCFPVPASPHYTSASCGVDSFLAAEGKHFLGSILVHTDANGYVAFGQTLVNAVPAAGRFMTATATKVVGGVPIEASEFSEAIEVGAADLINELTTKVNGLPEVRSAIKNALVVKLNAAQKALSTNDKNTACAALRDFIDLCVSQKNKKLIPATAADGLIADAMHIRTVIGCSP